MNLIMNAAQLMEQEAVAFAKWLSDSEWKPHDKVSGWWLSDKGEELTSSQLYDRFKSEQ